MVKKIIFHFSMFIFSSVFSSSKSVTIDSHDRRLLQSFHEEERERLCIQPSKKYPCVDEWFNDPYQKGFMDFNIRLRHERVIKNDSCVPFKLYIDFLDHRRISATRELTKVELEDFRNILAKDDIQRIREKHRII